MVHVSRLSRLSTHETDFLCPTFKGNIISQHLYKIKCIFRARLCECNACVSTPYVTFWSDFFYAIDFGNF